MSLLIDENETFEIKVTYVKIKDGLRFYEESEEAPEYAQREWFRFKRPNWEETCEMMSYAMVPYNGTVILNPYRFIDAKLKVLMTAWSIKDKNGMETACSPENVAKLNPALCEYLSAKLDYSVLPISANEPPVADDEQENELPPQKAVKEEPVKDVKDETAKVEDAAQPTTEEAKEEPATEAASPKAEDKASTS